MTALTTRPRMTSKQLSGPGDVGLYINLEGQFAIVSVAPQDPNKRLTLSAFDRTAKRFEHRFYEGDQVLVFAGERVFEPDLSKPVGIAPPDANAGPTAFLGEDGAVYIVMRTMDGSDWRLVSLVSGQIVKWGGSPMFAFENWCLGVIGSDGHFVPLLRI